MKGDTNSIIHTNRKVASLVYSGDINVAVPVSQGIISTSVAPLASPSGTQP